MRITWKPDTVSTLFKDENGLFRRLSRKGLKGTTPISDVVAFIVCNKGERRVYFGFPDPTGYEMRLIHISKKSLPEVKGFVFKRFQCKDYRPCKQPTPNQSQKGT